MKNRRFSIVDRLKSFSYAFNGFRLLLYEEHNSRIHLFATICVIIAGYLLQISAVEWLALIIVIGLVLCMEIINTSIENICDFISPGRDRNIKTIKDIAAAGVLVSTIVATVIGLIIFLPKFIVL